MLFPAQDQKETQCVSCERNVNLQSTIHHEKCKVKKKVVDGGTASNMEGSCE